MTLFLFCLSHLKSKCPTMVFYQWFNQMLSNLKYICLDIILLTFQSSFEVTHCFVSKYLLPSVSIFPMFLLQVLAYRLTHLSARDWALASCCWTSHPSFDFVKPAQRWPHTSIERAPSGKKINTNAVHNDWCTHNISRKKRGYLGTSCGLY